jgi:hypothetical protein
MKAHRKTIAVKPRSMRPAVVRGTIADVLESGELMVRCPATTGGTVRCDLLESADTAFCRLRLGDAVLVLTPATPDENGCVLGRIGRYRHDSSAALDHLMIEAGESLSLKCGESSVDLRKDGKLMIRGVDVLTRAKRRQRIKGGSVAIN